MIQIHTPMMMAKPPRSLIDILSKFHSISKLEIENAFLRKLESEFTGCVGEMQGSFHQISGLD